MEGYSCSCIGWQKVLWWCQFFPIWATDLICVSQSLSHVQLFAIPWTVVRQANLSMETSRQEYWSGWPFPSPRNFPYTGIKSTILASPALAGRFLTTESAGKPIDLINPNQNQKLFCRYWQIDSRVYKNPEWMTQSWKGRTKLETTTRLTIKW